MVHLNGPLRKISSESNSDNSTNMMTLRKIAFTQTVCFYLENPLTLTTRTWGYQLLVVKQIQREAWRVLEGAVTAYSVISIRPTYQVVPTLFCSLSYC
jgi:hypothetical protein